MSNVYSLRASCALVLALAAASACDNSSNNVVDDDGGVDVTDAMWVDFSDADPFAPDAGASAGCSATSTQCNNCLDDDSDGLTDGFDPECTGLADNDEGSFATGISGDNIDAKTQDCFFDGNSGGGDDKCAYHTCCLTDTARDGTCPDNLTPPNYDPGECTATQTCINNCAPLTPPGCDCFGCCTVCDDVGCRDIAINPAISPGCGLENLHDTDVCKACVKSADCGGGSCNEDPTDCILCPGEVAVDLPPECGGTQECPGGATTCITTADCTATQYCSTGCCIENIG